MKINSMKVFIRFASVESSTAGDKLSLLFPSKPKIKLSLIVLFFDREKSWKVSDKKAQ